MGGRYGASDDGSSDYQDRRPDWGSRDSEQQTIAEAVRAVMQRQQRRPTDATDSRSRATETVDNSSRMRPQIKRSNVDQLVKTLTDTDDSIADIIAGNLTDLIRRANEEPVPDDESNK